MRDETHKTADVIIFVALGALVLLTLVAFAVNPAYEKGVWAGFTAIGVTLSGACGFKFGVTQAGGESARARTPDPGAPHV